jgi:peptidoglycan/LPS O-acetylase OafA/YrhL
VNKNFGWCTADTYAWAMPLDSGGLAADVFFVLSGFLVAHNLFKEMDK